MRASCFPDSTMAHARNRPSLVRRTVCIHLTITHCLSTALRVCVGWGLMLFALRCLLQPLVRRIKPFLLLRGVVAEPWARLNRSWSLIVTLQRFAFEVTLRATQPRTTALPNELLDSRK